MHHTGIIRVLCFGLIVSNAPYSYALSYIDGKLKLSGFGSLGAITTSSDEFYYKRDFADPEESKAGEINLSSLSVLGLQANYNPHPKLNFIGQVVIRDKPTLAKDTLVKIAAASLYPLPDWQLRVGRTLPRFYMLSDSKHIGYAHVWTIPVQEFYAPTSTNFIEGIDSTYTLALADGFLDINTGFGKAVYTIYDDLVGVFDLEFDNLLAINIEYSKQDWMLRASWVESNKGRDWQALKDFHSTMELAAEQLMWDEGYIIANELTIEDSRIQYASLGLNYDNGVYSIVSELGSLNSKSPIIPSTLNGYVSISKNIGKVTPYILLSKTHSTDEYTLNDTPPLQAQTLATTALNILNPNYNQSSISFGLRWNIQQTVALKTQWDYKKIAKGGYGLWARDESEYFPDSDRGINIYSVRLDFIF